MKADLIATRQAILTGTIQPQAVAEACLDVAQSPACAHVFMQLTPDQLQNTASTARIAQSPLAGLAVSAVSKALDVSDDDAKSMLESGKMSADAVAKGTDRATWANIGKPIADAVAKASDTQSSIDAGKPSADGALKGVDVFIAGNTGKVSATADAKGQDKATGVEAGKLTPIIEAHRP